MKNDTNHGPAPVQSYPMSHWELELEKSTAKYHTIAAWIAIVFDPLFAITDYYNIPESWSHLFLIRLSVSVITLITYFYRKYLPSILLVFVPFTLISLQNAYTYSLISDDGLLGHNLNYMALLVGGSMFIAWRFRYSMLVLAVSAIATAYFIDGNPNLHWDTFFVKGGLLVVASAAFMVTLIRTRHILTMKEIKARIALEVSNAEVQEQNLEIKAQNREIQLRGEEIKAINDNLEALVRKRTTELEKKNKALEDYAFINAHKLRSPVASILGLVNLLKKTPLNDEGKVVLDHLMLSVETLDEIVSTITKTIERGDRAGQS